MTNKIKFRSKFVKAFQHSNADEQVLRKAFEEFLKHGDTFALDLLWRLTFEPCSQGLWLIWLDPQSISDEVHGVLRNELRYQYTQEHPDFLSYDKIPVELADVFSNLSNRSDTIVANVVLQKCTVCIRTKVANKEFLELRKISYLLGSRKENNFFGGLKSLGFQHDEATYLKPYRQEIQKLFTLMVHDHIKDLAPDKEQVVEDVKVPEELDVDEILYDNSTATSTEQPADAFTKITPENILTHKDVFSSFALDGDLNALIQIGKLGFDLNAVSLKKEAIANIIKGANALLA